MQLTPEEMEKELQMLESLDWSDPERVAQLFMEGALEQQDELWMQRELPDDGQPEEKTP